MEGDHTPDDPGQTRHEPPADLPGATRHEGTRHEATRHEGSQTRRQRSRPSPQPLTRLPSALARRYTVLRELPVQGAEADVLLARDKSGGEVVVKIFRQGYGVDPAVWQKLAGLSSPHVIRTMQTGRADGRDFEVMEYAGGGDLRVLMRRGEPAGAGPVAAVVGQLREGLVCLHEAGIVHRDLKPENVLVRSPDPLDLAITDFGLSRAFDESVVFASASRTLAYAAPESLSGQVSPARDWWSLGMMVLELATGRRAFAGMTETAVVDHLATRPIDTSGVSDSRLRLLCRGLLIRDPRRRWGADQIAAWLAGGSPAVADTDDDPRAGQLTGLPFNGATYTGKRALAAALVAGWVVAASRFFSVMHNRSGRPTEAWRTLHKWLTQFDDPRRDDVEGRIHLIDVQLTGDATPDLKLLHLILWLDPGLPPHFLGRRVSEQDLPRIAAAATDTTSPDHESARHLVRALWKQRALPALASFAGADALAAIDVRWRELARDWNGLAGRLRRDVPSPAGEPLLEVPADGDPPDLAAHLLALAADRDTEMAALTAAAARARALVTEPVLWFDSLASGSGDPLGLLALTLLAPRAAAEAEAAATRREELKRAAEHRAQRWREQEQIRLAGREDAVGRAMRTCLLLIPVLGIEALGAGALLPESSTSAREWTFIVLLVVAGIALAVETAIEVRLAKEQGGDYLPTGPQPILAAITGRLGQAMRGAGRGVSAAAGPVREGGCGGCCLLIVVGSVLLAVLSFVLARLGLLLAGTFLAGLVAMPAVHGVMAANRRRRWRESHVSEELLAGEGTSGA